MAYPTLMAVCLSALLVAPMVGQTGALKIVVIEGEGGVNIIQQKAAVRPLIEVRDRNNLPVAACWPLRWPRRRPTPSHPTTGNPPPSRSIVTAGR